MNLREIGWEGVDGDHWQAVVNMVINLQLS